MFLYTVLNSVTQILTDTCSGHAIGVPPCSVDTGHTCVNAHTSHRRIHKDTLHACIHTHFNTIYRAK